MHFHLYLPLRIFKYYQMGRVADKTHNLRWIVLIAYLMGLSMGVHLLNLLAIYLLLF